MITDSPKDLTDLSKYVPTGAATRRLGVHADTLRAMGRRGAIAYVRTASNRLLWNVDADLGSKNRAA